MLYPAIPVFCCIGVCSLHNNVIDVPQTAVFGLLGWIFAKLVCEPAPLLLGFILRPLMEENLRRALLLSGGDATVFVTRPLSAMLLALAVILLLAVAAPMIRRQAGRGFWRGRREMLSN